VTGNKNNKNPKRDSLSVSFSHDEKPEQMIRRFIKKVRNSGLVQELLQRRSYEKPSVRKKMKAIRAKFSRLSEEND
jgi:ribosomal protein S21